MAKEFVHLHVHSHYSLLDGLPTIDDLVEKVKEKGMKAVALTDHGVLYGAVEFFKKANKAGITPIIGCEMYVAVGKMDEFRPKIDDKRYHLVLLVKDERGYKNLVKLVTEAHLRGFYYKPRIDEDLLKEHSEGLICLSACLQGKIPRLILEGKIEEAERTALEYKEIFGPDNFYLELQHHPNIPEQEKVNKVLVKIAQKHKIPLVATNDVHYLKKEDAPIQDVLMLINTGADPADPDRLTLLGDDFSLRDPEEMWEAFSWVPEALENTLKIAESVNFEFEFGKLHFPSVYLPEGETANTYLRKLVYQGIKERYPQEPPHLRERIEHELRVIEKLGFAPYFLVVRDIVLWAKSNGIVVGPGRGSGAGSVVCYLLKITSVDPLKYNLLFERFLHEGRVSFPDIDLDFQDDKRDQVIKYIQKRFGEDKVAHIATFGTMASRAVVRDVGRALGYSYSYCDRIAKAIPPTFSLKEALDSIKDLQNLYIQDERARRLFDIAMKIEGRVRHVSTHAGGIVITPFPLTELVPLQYPARKAERVLTTQYEMRALEELGLLKIDVLGLRNLTTIKKTLELVEERYGKRINLSEIPTDDPKTFELYQKGETEATFQFNSEAMQQNLRKLKPTTLEDLIALIALYRPGPMKYIDEFVARKHGKKKIEYLHPDLEEILKETYGVLVYQEQLMAISKKIAGFTDEEADTLRKAVGKKIKELLIEQGEKFVKGAVQKGYPEELAKRLWEWILPFASYGFNKSHAAAYAITAYHTAYLKANYPLEYMTAVLMTEKGDVEKMAEILQECKRLGIRVLPPEINLSQRTFSISGENEIRFGLEDIKNVGEAIVTAILEEREARGPFKDFFDFCERVSPEKLNKKALESLIKAGAFDNMGERKELLYNLETILNWVRKKQKNKKNGGQLSLFGDKEESKPQLEKVPPATKREKLLWEKELLGLFVTSHPMEEILHLFQGKVVPLEKMVEVANRYSENVRIKIAGVISDIKRVITRQGSSMLFVTVEDHTGSLEVVAFPSIVEQNPVVFQENKIVLIEGTLKNSIGDIKVVCERIEEIQEEL